MHVVWQSEIILKVNAPEEFEIPLLNPGTTLVSFPGPGAKPGVAANCRAQCHRDGNGLRTAYSCAVVIASSMANIAGYRAIVEAAHERSAVYRTNYRQRKVPPAKVMVIGAGKTTGLAAIGAANSLGAIVQAFDTRPEVKEQALQRLKPELDFKEEWQNTEGLNVVAAGCDVRRVYQSGNRTAPGRRKTSIFIVTTALIRETGLKP